MIELTSSERQQLDELAVMLLAAEQGNRMVGSVEQARKNFTKAVQPGVVLALLAQIRRLETENTAFRRVIGDPPC